MKLDFRDVPPIGTIVRIDGQPYTLSGLRDHEREDGRGTLLLDWRTHCTDCGAAFVASSPLKSSGFVRRCPGCRKLGARVGGRRKSKIVIQRPGCAPAPMTSSVSSGRRDNG